MKRITTLFLLLFTVALTSAFVAKPSVEKGRGISQDAKIELPDNIKEIVEAKCMNCHKPDARNEKAREKLQWIKVPEMNKEQQEDFIAEMFEVIEEGEMPPARMVERNPKMKLNDEENKAFIAWLEKEENRIKGK